MGGVLIEFGVGVLSGLNRRLPHDNSATPSAHVKLESTAGRAHPGSHLRLMGSTSGLDLSAGVRHARIFGMPIQTSSPAARSDR